MNSNTISKAVTSVTSKWTKHRKAEERGRSQSSRRDAMKRRSHVSIVDAAQCVMKEAYMKASGGGKYPASARQIMYAARGEILRRTGKTSLDSAYFSQTILPDYLEENPQQTAGWDVVYDARGHFTEPHTERSIALGTINVRQYLRDTHQEEHEIGELDVDAIFPDRLLRCPTHGPENRFDAILFIEKEGFEPVFNAAKLAERYDLAIMSTKGMPVVACRHLADVLCGQHGIPLFVLHDFDKAGFSILGTLQDVDKWDPNTFDDARRRYEFRHEIDVIDLGVRLQDVKDHGLESETVRYRSDPRHNLEQNGATDEEIGVLCVGGNKVSGYRGERVELNAFTSDVFIEWIETRLKEHGIKKVAPDAETLERVYRRATQMSLIRQQLSETVEEAGEQAEEARLPQDLEGMIRSRLDKNPTRSWDDVVTELADAAWVVE